MVSWFLALSGIPVSGLAGLMRELKDYLPYISVAFGATSYILGMIAHRAVQLLPTKSLDRLARLFRLSPRCSDSWWNAILRIWQYGSDRLNREIDFQYSLVAPFRSLLLSVPILGSGVVAWLWSSRNREAWTVLGFTIVGWILCALVFRRQWNHYNELRRVAIEALAPVERKALEPGRLPNC